MAEGDEKEQMRRPYILDHKNSPFMGEEPSCQTHQQPSLNSTIKVIKFQHEFWRGPENWQDAGVGVACENRMRVTYFSEEVICKVRCLFKGPEACN